MFIKFLRKNSIFWNRLKLILFRNINTLFKLLPFLDVFLSNFFPEILIMTPKIVFFLALPIFFATSLKA